MKDLKMRIPAALLMVAATAVLWAKTPPPAGTPQASKPPQTSKPTQTPKPKPTPTFRSATDLVTSHVVVRDETGRFIPDLTQKEFEVYEDGVLQKVTTFAAIIGGRAMTEVVPDVVTEREGLILPKTTRVVDVPGRIFIIFIDDLHLQPLDSPMVKQVLKQIRDNLLHEGDLIGLVSSGYSSISFDLSPDPKHLRFNQAIDKTMGAGMTPTEIINTAQTIEGPSGLRANVFTALKVAYEILDQAERISNRRKAFIYVSSGYDFNPFTNSRYQAYQELFATAQPAPQAEDVGKASRDPLTGLAGESGNIPARNPFESGHLEFSDADLAQAMGELVRRARRADTTFYPVDPRGLIAAPPAGTTLSNQEWFNYVNTSLSSLDVIAAETGGKCICRTNDFKKGLQAVDNDMSDYYMVGYESNNPDPTKVRRRIEVKVTRPGAQKPIYKDWYTIKR
jgi:VWFA-related protein